MDRGKKLWCVFNPFIRVPPTPYNDLFSKRCGCQNAQSMVLATSDLPSVSKSTIIKARVVADISGLVFEWGGITLLFFFFLNKKVSSATNQLVHITHSNFFLSFQY